MLLRKRITTSSILAVALLVALIASMNSMFNHFNFQAQALEELVTVGGTFLILSKNSSNLSDSQINPELSGLLKDVADIKYVQPQKILTTSLTMDTVLSYTVLVRGVSDVSDFLNQRRAYVNGTMAKGDVEANIGVILSRSLSVYTGENVTLIFNGNLLNVSLVGIVRTVTQCDSEIIVQMNCVHQLTGNDRKISFIEFALEDGVETEEAIARIRGMLPVDVTMVKAQQLKEFMLEMNNQTLNFLDLWSLTIYIAVACASYIVASSLISESSYELSMLRAVGARRVFFFILILAYTLTVVFIGSGIGVALGLTGTQTVSTLFQWMQLNIEITPFLKLTQAAETFLITLTFSVVGCAYPALKLAYSSHIEQSL